MRQQRFYSILQRSKPAIGQLRGLIRARFALLRPAIDEDRPHADIERALSIPLGTVKSRLHYARKALKTLWEEKNENAP